MPDNTGIEWCDATWNPIRGCSRVSEGCRHCYAERVAARFSGPGQPYEGLARRVGSEARWTNTVRLVEAQLDQPLCWRKPRRIFVNSMSDLFHEGLDDAAIVRHFAVMALCPQHTFMVLTKRPERMRDYLREEYREGRIWTHVPGYVETGRHRELMAWPLPNVWLGVSIENQATADTRIPILLQTPARVRFVSAEPLLAPVDLRLHLSRTSIHCPEHVTERIRLDELSYLQALSRAFVTPLCPVCGGTAKAGLAPALDWVIVGGESGPRARPMRPDWARGLRDQCKSAGVPFFFKQWGSCWPEPNAWMAPGWRQKVERHGSPKKLEATIEGVRHHEWPTP